MVSHAIHRVLTLRFDSLAPSEGFVWMQSCLSLLALIASAILFFFLKSFTGLYAEVLPLGFLEEFPICLYIYLVWLSLLGRLLHGEKLRESSILLLMDIQFTQYHWFCFDIAFNLYLMGGSH